MTPNEFNALVRNLATILRAGESVTDAQLIVEADDAQTAPEIGVTIDGVDLFLTVELV